MGDQANTFIASFNRIEKWMRDEMGNPSNMGFSELTRRLSRRNGSQVREYQEDLLQIAQLRNAIVHDRIAPDFVIAEPNEWVLNRIHLIEKNLTEPETVIPKFKKYVTGFDKNTWLKDILKIVAEKGFSQFPIYDKGNFLGLITAHGLGLWMASQNANGSITIEGITVAEVLENDRRRNNYLFVNENTYIYQTIQSFLEHPSIEAILITKDGNPNGNLIGIIRPKDVFTDYYEEWREN